MKVCKHSTCCRPCSTTEAFDFSTMFPRPSLLVFIFIRFMVRMLFLSDHGTDFNVRLFSGVASSECIPSIQEPDLGPYIASLKCIDTSAVMQADLEEDAERFYRHQESGDLDIRLERLTMVPNCLERAGETLKFAGF